VILCDRNQEHRPPASLKSRLKTKILGQGRAPIRLGPENLA